MTRWPSPNRAAALDLRLRGQGVARWVDLDGDGAQELVWAGPAEVRVLSRDGERYETSFRAPHAGEKTQIAVGDLEGDGDPDLYLASPFGASLVLRNDGGVPSPLEPAAVVEHTYQMYQPKTRRPFGLLDWPALLRKLDRMDPSYRD